MPLKRRQMQYRMERMFLFRPLWSILNRQGFTPGILHVPFHLLN